MVRDKRSLKIKLEVDEYSVDNDWETDNDIHTNIKVFPSAPEMVYVYKPECDFLLFSCS